MLPPKRTLPCVLARAQHDSTGILTILREHTPEPDPQALALGALGWVLADDDHAERLLALTGLAPDDLRARLGEAGVQVAVLDFLAAHERDAQLGSGHVGGAILRREQQRGGGADDLAARRLRVEDAPCRTHGKHPAQTDLAGRGVDRDQRAELELLNQNLPALELQQVTRNRFTQALGAGLVDHDGGVEMRLQFRCTNEHCIDDLDQTLIDLHLDDVHVAERGGRRAVQQLSTLHRGSP